MKPNTSVQYLSGVGPKMAEKLQRLGIETVHDLLFYYPRRYDDFSKPEKIQNLRLGREAIIKAKIFQIKQIRTKRRWMSIIEAILADDSGQIKAIWFNQPFLLNILKPGDEWLFGGKVGFDFKGRTKNFSVTQYEKEPIILPVYSETEGITSKYLRRLIKPLLLTTSTTSATYEVAEKWFDEYLPAEILKSQDLLDLDKAIKKIHFPNNNEDIQAAKKRLGFDELFLIALRVLFAKNELSKSQTIVLKIDNIILKEFVEKLPFKLTNSQRKCAWEIIKDLSKSVPMNRLLEGDVGSGKTVVAAMAVLVAAKNNYQTVWLAPTEILANQHFKNVTALLKPFKIKVGLLTSANKNANLTKDDLIIGTHALLQKDIIVPKLALIIVDEQHRFGVKQRAHLRQKKKYIPHLLSMTATPIPRTLALSLYGDLDLSIIDEMPTGRQKIITHVVDSQNRQKAYDFIRTQIKSGRQAFVICPLIEESKPDNKLFELDRKSATKEYKKLSQEIFPDLKIGLLHGRLKSKEKSQVMKKFQAGDLNILVSTAVVEVGIDIPNATVMMIESAQRFGLAQLHQFRGRVGRAKYQSYCFLFSEGQSENNKLRLQAMTRCHNGFELAEIDLKLRGPGELIGIRQSGIPDLKMASLSDILTVKKARQIAEDLISQGLEKYPKIQEKLKEYESERHLE